MAPVSQTYGAMLIGALLAVCLSGIVCTQCFLYFRVFPNDRLKIKALVLVVWVLDGLHTSFVCTALWHYLIVGFNDPTVILRIQYIGQLAQVAICITGVTTFLIQCDTGHTSFFGHRVWTLSKGNKWITSIIVVLAFLRMLCSFCMVIPMSRLHTWTRFHELASWSFTTGLIISACVDFLIASSLVYYLNKNRTGFAKMDYVIDTIVLYSIENGVLTSITVVVTFICWLTMPNNFIFLAMHFVIAKMYANSLLSTLNARKHIVARSDRSEGNWQDHNIRLPSLFTGEGFHRGRDTTKRISTMRPAESATLQINVEKSVHCVTDIGTKTISINADTMEPTHESTVIFIHEPGEVADSVCGASHTSTSLSHNSGSPV
ncbi:hypothetical protein BC629DRAFT_1588321 [Irpex lacteus]|nr:hypothetical protein BC629DRAFT_1588321 [Irpex lacteus]